MRERFDTLAFSNPTERPLEHRQFIDAMEPVIYDLEFILNIIDKIEWITKMYAAQTLSEHRWEAYVQTDIHAFHVECRSILDAVAVVVSSLSTKNDQVPDSFNKLQKACVKNSARIGKLLGTDVTELIASIDWFSSLRDRRDFIVHHRRDALVKFDSKTNKILFRTMFASTSEAYTGPQEFAFEDDWILFQAYAGYYVGRLLYFLDTFTSIICERLSIRHITSKPYSPPAYESAERYMQLAKYCLTPTI